MGLGVDAEDALVDLSTVALKELEQSGGAQARDELRLLFEADEEELDSGW